jgi:hypothetical protein
LDALEDAGDDVMPANIPAKAFAAADATSVVADVVAVVEEVVRVLDASKTRDLGAFVTRLSESKYEVIAVFNTFPTTSA